MFAAVRQASLFSKEDLDLYLGRISFPRSETAPLPTHQILSKILDSHLKSIPIGALALNYHEKLSEPLARPVNALDPYSTKGVSIHPRDVFDRLVLQRREGLCFEQCILLRHMLEMIGFTIFIAGSRIFDPVAWEAGQELLRDLTHCVLVVTIDNLQYLIDPGFSHFSTPSPVPLDGTPIASEGCLRHRVLPFTYTEPGHSYPGPTNTEYRLEVQFGTKAWRPTVAFSLAPLYQQDLEVLNFFIMLSPTKFFHRHISLTLFVKDGYLLLVDDQLVTRINGTKTAAISLPTETDRIRAFEKYFNLQIHQKEHLPSEFGSLSAMIDHL